MYDKTTEESDSVIQLHTQDGLLVESKKVKAGLKSQDIIFDESRLQGGRKYILKWMSSDGFFGRVLEQRKEAVTVVSGGSQVSNIRSYCQQMCFS